MLDLNDKAAGDVWLNLKKKETKTMFVVYSQSVAEFVSIRSYLKQSGRARTRGSEKKQHDT